MKLNPYLKEEFNHAKEIHKELEKEYNIKIPLVFEDLSGRNGGFIETRHLKGFKKKIKRIVLDGSGNCCFDPDYVLCHEWAHAILVIKKKSLRHTKAHANLTYKLACRYGLCSK